MQEIVVIDLGSQYTQLIVKRVRSLGAYARMVAPTISYDEIRTNENIKGIILSGGPKSVYEKDAYTLDSRLLDGGIPVLGICYGMQWMMYTLGGVVTKGAIQEYGKTTLTITKDDSFLDGIPTQSIVWMSHQDEVRTLPPNFISLARSENNTISIVRSTTKPLYGMQFHPEVEHTEYGRAFLSQFIHACAITTPWSMENYIEEQTNLIQKTVGTSKVLLGISGGVDSSVAAILLHRALGSQLSCLFVDHGLLRKDEARKVRQLFVDHLKIPVDFIDASSLFLSRLKTIEDPEAKRKIIGKTFIDVFESHIKKNNNYRFLAQGTLYTDIIESGTATAKTIKSHHNVGGLPKEMNLKLVEPLKWLYKDEVRILGKVLGLPDEILQRPPFPGPGLAIRILGEITKDKIRIVQETDAILHEELKNHGLDQAIWQYFTVLTNSKTVGVMGDNRTYQYIVAIRAVTSIDGMTAEWARIPHEVLSTLSNRMINEVVGCNRVVYDITTKPPATIEWE